MASSIQTISIAIAILGSIASTQCASHRDPELAIEDEPAEALFGLAEQFREQGDVEARKSTLRYIVKRYPSSRFAARAERDLDELGVETDRDAAP